MSTEPQYFLHKGWLFKKSRHLKIWRKRFGVLTKSSFQTFENEDINSLPTEKISIKNLLSVQSASEELTHPYSFKIETPNGFYYFYLEKEDEKDRWVGILSQIIRQTNHSIEKQNL